MLEKLRKLNDFPVYSCEDKEFFLFGKIVSGYNMSDLIKYVDKNTPNPKDSVIYTASDKEMENMPIYKEIKENIYGGMDIEIGYCNGNNSLLNGLEYHKGSETLIAVTDVVLLLAHISDIENGKIDSSKVKGFYVKKGTAVELYQTTLHFAPCMLENSGFKAVIILPKDTNTEIDLANKKINAEEDKFLFMRNKWLLVHNDMQDLIKQGAHKGLIGKNLKVNF